MKELALTDEILMVVEKPARYIGSEVNAVVKDQAQIDIRFAMCFPDVYEIGMSHLGIQIIYDLLNRESDIWCERVYSPWPDLDHIMRENNIPLFALESQDPIRNFDFLGITIQYEMCYTNILQVLDLSQIPLLADERGENDPIVIGGGPCATNPEPLADFFDLFYIGEAETQMISLMRLYQKMKREGADRKGFLSAAAQIPGIYVPSLYEVTYQEDGLIESFVPADDTVPEKVVRQVVMDLSNVPYPEKPIVPFIKATQDRVTLEIQRGCIRGCRFCQAGMIYRPLRERDLPFLKRHAECMLKNSGQDEISLSSLSSSDYSKLPQLLDYLIDEIGSDRVNISLPSLRIDAFSLDVMSKVQDVRKSSLTFAPEAGSQRMRDVINKGLTKEDILGGAKEAFEGGWNKIKLYFMLGLPTETLEDQKAIAHLAEAIAELYYDTVPKEKRVGKCQIQVSTSFFVPKPFTPFQWATMCREEEYLERAHTVKSEIIAQLNQKSIRYHYHEADVTVLEGLLARGDRRLSKLILTAYQSGALFDAWTEYFDYSIWKHAYQSCRINPDFYTIRTRSTDEILPWDFIDCGVTKTFLIHEWERALSEKTTPNCRVACQGCGMAKEKGGVCVEGKD